MTEEEKAKKMFEESVKKAEKFGVPEERILRTKDDIDAYFKRK